MDPAFDSARTAGYRDVVVNLQLVGEDAERLGVARHICELQLILVPVFARKVRRCLLLGDQSNKHAKNLNPGSLVAFQSLFQVLQCKVQALKIVEGSKLIAVGSLGVDNLIHACPETCYLTGFFVPGMFCQKYRQTCSL